MAKITRTQKTEKARQKVEKYLNLHLPELQWRITRSTDAIFPETHAGRHSMGHYSAFCILQDMENGKLLQDAQAHRDRFVSDALIQLIQEKTGKQNSLMIDCSKCVAHDKVRESSEYFARLRKDEWAHKLWNKGWRVQGSAAICPECARNI